MKNLDEDLYLLIQFLTVNDKDILKNLKVQTTN